MAYSCELSPHQKIYLDNSGGQTTISTSSGSSGQQQQSSSTFETGDWTAKPELFETSGGVVLKLTSDRGDIYIQIQGSSMSSSSSAPSLDSARPLPLQEVPRGSFSSMPSMKPMEPMKPMQPMKPIQPMKMGKMPPSPNTMEMRMGNMEMRMGVPSSESTRRFCSQCGAPVATEDCYCSSCGHQLG